MIHTTISSAQQTVFVSNHPQIVEKVAENKGLYDERPLRKTSALQRALTHADSLLSSRTMPLCHSMNDAIGRDHRRHGIADGRCCRKIAGAAARPIPSMGAAAVQPPQVSIMIRAAGELPTAR
jgi:hypothetical protein